MLDYMKRILIVIIMALCVSIIIIGGRVQAAEINIKDITSNWYFPAEGEISDVFESRGGIHKGIDIAGDYKSPVYVVEDGEVIKSYFSQSYGNVVFVHHLNGFETVYAHLDKRLVIEGQKVKKGEEIGLLGNTGNSTGNHLHFEIHNGEWTIDKENAIDPFLVFGKGELGQLVFALNHDPYGVMDVGGAVGEDKEEEMITSFYIPNKNNTIQNLPVNTIMNINSQTNTGKSVKDKSGKELNDKFYIVKKGDTLNKISRMYHVSVQQLQSWNKLANMDLIIPDQKIIIQQNK